MAPEKSPAFQFYPKEFLMDGKVIVMSLSERGRLFTKIAQTVLSGDREGVKQWQGRFIGRVYWHEKQSRPYIPPVIRSAVFLKHGRICVSCGSTERIELDHIVAFSKGGPDTTENLQPLCKHCNRSKGAR